MSTTPKIGYVSAHPERLLSSGTPITPFAAEPFLSQTIDRLQEADLQALVVDYDLFPSVEEPAYCGHRVIAEMRELKEGLPLFLLADPADMAEAERLVPYVHLVYNRTHVLGDLPAFWRRVHIQMEKESRNLQREEARLLSLMHAAHSLSAAEEQEVNSLNYKIEKRLDKRAARDFAPFTLSHQEKLGKVLEKADALLAELQKNETPI